MPKLDILDEEHREILGKAGWKEMASHGWRRTERDRTEYIEPYTAFIVAEWWLEREEHGNA